MHVIRCFFFFTFPFLASFDETDFCLGVCDTCIYLYLNVTSRRQHILCVMLLLNYSVNSCMFCNILHNYMLHNIIHHVFSSHSKHFQRDFGPQIL